MPEAEGYTYRVYWSDRDECFIATAAEFTVYRMCKILKWILLPS